MSNGQFIFGKMTTEQKIFQALEKHVPPNAVQYCWDQWQEDPFNFYITKSRSSKLGDFRFRRDRAVQTITINNDLNLYQFLITFLHEVAHHTAYKKYGIGIKPHGVEWKKTFQQILSPMLSDLVFPIDILIPLRRYLLNPKASTGADLFLNKEVKKYNQKTEGNQGVLLCDLRLGDMFLLKGRRFQKEATRRTRVLCLEVTSGKKYLISAHAEIHLEKH